MKKSISGFALGLVATIIGGFCAYYYWAIFAIVGAFSDGILKTILTILPLINMGSFVLSLIGSIICLFRAKVGGIILLVASTISLICFTTIFITIKSFSLIVLLMVLPSFWVFLAGIIACKKIKKS